MTDYEVRIRLIVVHYLACQSLKIGCDWNVSSFLKRGASCLKSTQRLEIGKRPDDVNLIKNPGRVFLHIGIHKTGTTAIQSAFARYNDGLLLYAPLIDINHSIPFYTAFSGDHLSYHIWNEQNLSDKEVETKRNFYFREIRKVLASNKDRDLFFSGEDISVVSRVGVEKIAAECKRSGREVTVIAYVRSPHSFSVSELQERIRRGYPNPLPQSPNYRDKIGKFIEVFGRENVIIRDFDAIKEANGDVVDDISNLVQSSFTPRGGSFNVGMSTEAVKVVSRINKIVGYGEKQNWIALCRLRCVEHVCTLFPGKFDVPSNLMSPYIDFTDVDWLRSVSGIDYRGGTTVILEQGSVNLTQYLNEVGSPTKEIIRETLMARDGLNNPPHDTDALLSRYLLSFAIPAEIEFDPDRYLELNQDIREAGVNPYVHYVHHGLREGRSF